MAPGWLVMSAGRRREPTRPLTNIPRTHGLRQATAVEVWFADFEAALMKYYLGQAEQPKVAT
jgi:hypothetical protein